MSKESLYFDKEHQYFTNVRYDIIDMIPKKPNKVLEIGCGSGATLIAAKQLNKAEFTVGVDIVDKSIPGIDSHIVGDIENIIIPFEEKYFDVIICADVLEHLVDPWAVVHAILKFLKDGGLLIASIPNVREIEVLWKIAIKGDFAYSSQGILDRSHLRFFCKKNIFNLFFKNNLKVVNLKRRRNSKLKAALDYGTFGIFSNFLTCQYVVAGRMNNRE